MMGLIPLPGIKLDADELEAAEVPRGAEPQAGARGWALERVVVWVDGHRHLRRPQVPVEDRVRGVAASKKAELSKLKSVFSRRRPKKEGQEERKPEEEKKYSFKRRSFPNTLSPISKSTKEKLLSPPISKSSLEKMRRILAKEREEKKRRKQQPKDQSPRRKLDFDPEEFSPIKMGKEGKDPRSFLSSSSSKKKRRNEER